MNKKICHLIVGFSIFDYFKNLLISTLELDKISDIIVITTGDPKLFGWGGLLDYKFEESKKVKDLVEELKIKYSRNNIFYFEMDKIDINDEKVGGLYQAYNLGLQKAIQNKVDFLNIMQNDSQLMLWSEKIIDILTDIFESQNDVFYISPAFFRKTTNFNIEKNHISRKIAFKNFNKKRNLYLSDKSAVGDWGIFNISKIKKINFKFERNEDFLSKNYYEKGFKLAYSPIPFVSLLPWPVTVRNGRIKGSVLKFRNEKYLKLAENIDENTLFDNNFVWKEDCVKPNNWWSLEPNWATDFSFEYFKIVFKIILKNRKISEVCYSNNNKKRYIYPPSLTSPCRPELLKTILYSPFNFILKLIHKIIRKINK